jgi:hypothetical protein
MDETTRKAFDDARDTAKQLLTLTTAILTLTIAFANDLVGVETMSGRDRVRLQFAWMALFASIVAGLLNLFALLGASSPTTRDETDNVVPKVNFNPSIYARGLTGFAACQQSSSPSGCFCSSTSGGRR